MQLTSSVLAGAAQMSIADAPIPDDVFDPVSNAAIDLGRRIQALREQAGQTQRNVADAVGSDTASVSRWERGKIEPKADHIRELARHFGVSADYLLGLGEGSPAREHPAFAEFAATPLGQMAQDRGWLEKLRRMPLPVEPTVDTYKAIALALLSSGA